ncbi:MAG: glycosyltransferase family 4 protein [DPANN group archaeon]|nr:glycosyltransferase family 4 protein [DPANN group archaeon]
MKILILTFNFPYKSAGGTMGYGGGDIAVLQHAQELTSRGHKAIVVSRKSRSDHGGEIYPNTYRTPSFGFHNRTLTGFDVLRFINLATRIAKQEKVDIIESHNPIGAVVGYFVAKRTKKPHVIYMHGPWAKARELSNTGLMTNKIARGIEGFTLRRANLIITVSESLKKELLHKYALNKKKITHIANAVDADFFKPMEKNNARQRLNLPIDKFIILYTGRFVEEKGIFDLLKAAEEFKNKNVLFLLVGDEARSKWLHEQVKNKNLARHFKIAPFTEYEEMPYYYSAADLFVLPSYAEGMSRAMLEAMSCQTAVAVTPVGGNSEVVKHEKNGLLIEPKNPRDIAHAINYILRNKNKAGEMAKTARKTIIQGHTVKRRTDAFISAYQDLLKKKK